MALVQAHQNGAGPGRRLGVSNRPGGCEQPPLARIAVGQRHTQPLRVLRLRGAVGVGAHGDGGGAQLPEHSRPERPDTAADVGQRLERLHHRDIVCVVDDRRRGVGDERQPGGIGPHAVELGEVGHHAPADLSRGERSPRGGVPVCQGREIGQCRGRLVALEVGGRNRQDGVHVQAGAGAGPGRRREFLRGLRRRGESQVQADLPPRRHLRHRRQMRL